MIVTRNPKGEPMHALQPDWRRNKLAHIYLRYHSAIHARSREGQPYIMRAFYAVLVHEGLKVKQHGPDMETPFDPQTGAGYLLVEQAFVVDLVCVPRITPEIVLRHFSDIPYALHGKYEPFLLNFGSAGTQGYPGPMDEALWNTFNDPDLDESLPKFRGFLTHQPILIGENHE
jgi:hypothetical protein